MVTDFTEFVLGLRYGDLPAAIVAILKRSLLDTVGVAAVGTQTTLSRIVRAYVTGQWCAAPGAPRSRILLDGADVSPAGAAMAGAFTIDAIDAHDGFSPAKGHAGSAVLPSVLAFLDDLTGRGTVTTGQDLLTALAVAYEVSYRAGLSLHATAADYHTSGAWTAVGIATTGARLLGLSADGVRHAAGIAEYHGPRSQMMRCIDHPTMVRDGVGWGAPTGVSAAYLAALGFTGAPAITIESQEVAPHWSGLGTRWEIEATHYKRYPVCRWAHPAIDAAADLMRAHGLASGDVARIRIRTFHNATRLAGHEPRTLDEFTYAIAFPVATMIVRGKIGVEELSPEVRQDPEILRLSRATELVETEHYTRISTRKRWADLTLFLKDSRILESPARTPVGDPDDPLSDSEIRDKFRMFADPVLGEARARAIEALVAAVDEPATDVRRVLDLLCGGRAGSGAAIPPADAVAVPQVSPSGAP